jgi:hypothetical protein
MKNRLHRTKSYGKKPAVWKLGISSSSWKRTRTYWYQVPLVFSSFVVCGVGPLSRASKIGPLEEGHYNLYVCLDDDDWLHSRF